MEVIDKIYKAIKTNSDFIIQHGDEWKRELGGSKNFICTPDFKHWTFGKSVGADGAYHYNGGVAKQRLYSQGFINAFDLKDKKLRENILTAFFVWAAKVKTYPIGEKFERDQKANHRFELLVHKSILDNVASSAKKKKAKTIQQIFDEGFKKEIIHEVFSRDRRLILLAKQKHGTVCSVCKFDFGETYGEHGEGFVEMHHLFPIANGKRKTTIEDLRPVCANCHRMLHKGKKLLSIEELKEIIELNKGKK